jgi:hypothetical protein
MTDDLGGDLSRLRRGAYEFLRGSAAQAWEHEDGGERWDITLPPDLAALPERQRFRVHARQEARRVARARLYDLDPRVAGLAVRLGESIGQVSRDGDAPAPSPVTVTAPWVIRPPAAAGFVRWRDAIGCNSLGAPVVSRHWGPWGAPAAGGTWLAWWADSGAMAAAYEAAARADGQHASFGDLTEAFGPLWYDHQELLRPGTAPGDSAVPEPQATAPASSPPEDGTSGLALLRTTLATWHLMTCPEVVQLTRRPLPAAEQAADRAAGLAAGSVTFATATGKP